MFGALAAQFKRTPDQALACPRGDFATRRIASRERYLGDQWMRHQRFTGGAPAGDDIDYAWGNTGLFGQPRQFEG